MPALSPPVCEFGKKAIDFKLPDCEDNRVFSLEQCRGKNGLLIMFICNHCPYVQSIILDLISTTKVIAEHGINTVAIMSNDWTQYPEDAPEKMLEFKRQYDFDFPYLIDKTQEVAKKYGAVCTPDFFGYNKNLELQYRGRFDSRGKNNQNDNDIIDNSNDLQQAMLQIAETDHGPKKQTASIGCSIKWK